MGFIVGAIVGFITGMAIGGDALWGIGGAVLGGIMGLGAAASQNEETRHKQEVEDLLRDIKNKQDK